VKGRKRKDSADDNVEAYRHENETRKNVVPVGLASYDTYDTSTPKPRKYEYDPHLDPHLVWTGKQKTHPLKFLPNLSISMKEYRLKP